MRKILNRKRAVLILILLIICSMALLGGAIEMTIRTRAEAESRDSYYHELKDSTLYSNSGNLFYNCYAYAIGIPLILPGYPSQLPYQPGEFSGEYFDAENMQIE